MKSGSFGETKDNREFKTKGVDANEAAEITGGH